MRKFLALLTLAFPTCLVAEPAQAEDGADWYVGVSGTLSLLNDSHTSIINLPIPGGFAETDNHMDTGGGAQVAIGKKIGNARLEIEGGYSENKSKHYTAILPPTGEISSEGGHKVWRAVFNAYYDFGSGEFRPYLGAGIGYADVKARLFAARAPFPNETPFLIMNDHKGEFVYQAMEGAAYEISSGISLTAQYRWLSAGKVHFRDLSDFEHIREHEGHNLDLGLRIAL